MSLTPSATITSRTPGCSKTSRRIRASPLAPKQRLDSCRLLPEIPAFKPDGAGDVWGARRRSASRSDQPALAFSVESNPAVIESPSATTAPASGSRAATSTPSSQYQAGLVTGKLVAVVAAVKSPGPET